MYRVLVVDDEHLIRNGIAYQLNWDKAGFEVVATACNGKEALTIMSNQFAPDVVLTDIRMPEMDGIELCKNIKYQYPQVKVVILSGYNEFEYAQKAIEYGVYAYLLKPLNEDEVIQLFIKIKEELDSNQRNTQQLLNIEKDYYIDYCYQAEQFLAQQFQVNDQGNKLISPFTENFFCAIAFSVDNELSNEKTIWSIGEIVRTSHDYWRKLNFPIFYTNQYFYIIVNHKKKIKNNMLDDMLKKFSHYLLDQLSSEHKKAIVTFGVGLFYESANSLKHSVTEARQALQTKFYLGKGCIIWYKEVAATIVSSNSSLDISKQLDDMVDAILSSEQNRFILNLKEINRLFRDMKIHNIQILNVKCVQAYTYILRSINKHVIYADTLSEDDLYHGILSCSTFNELSEYLESILMDLFYSISNTKNVSISQQLVQKVKKYVNEHYQDKLSLTSLSEVFHLSPSYLSSLFKDETGGKLFDYIYDCRMDAAKELLKNSSQQVQAIATQVGYDDFRHFSTVFKKATGYTPLQYRLHTIMEDTRDNER